MKGDIIWIGQGSGFVTPGAMEGTSSTSNKEVTQMSKKKRKKKGRSRYSVAAWLRKLLKLVMRLILALIRM